jgi:hypothetical protein
MISLKIKDCNSDRKKTFIIISGRSSNHIEELSDCLSQIDSIANRFAPDFRILRINIFVDSKNISEYNNIKNDSIRIITNYSNTHIDLIDIPKSFIAQPPVNHKKICIEFTALILPSSEYNYKFFNKGEGSYYKLLIGTDEEIYGSVSDISTENINIYNHSSKCFNFIKDVLETNNLNFRNIIRQWAYIGNLNDNNFFENSEIENYQMFNLSRVKYYKNIRWEFGFPSATGIGANIDGCSLEFIATNEIIDKFIIPLHNPRQLDAHRYSEKFQVIDSSIINSAIPQKTENTPKFERGKVVISKDFMDIYISGTAAILGEDSIAGDIVVQTKTTLENIERLSSKENLYEHGIKVFNNLPQFSSVRAYIKFAKDEETVEKMCRKFFGNIPILFIIADVCRKELLIEIEAFISCRIQVD